MHLPSLQLSCRLLFGKASHHPGLLAALQPRFGSLRLLAFPKAKNTVEREEICECDVHTVHTLIQRRLTADWLALRESDCSRMHSKVSSDWVPSYIKATQPVLEIFKMAGYTPDSHLINILLQLDLRPLVRPELLHHKWLGFSNWGGWDGGSVWHVLVRKERHTRVLVKKPWRK